MKNYNEVNLNYIRDILEFIDKKETVRGRRYSVIWRILISQNG